MITQSPINTDLYELTMAAGYFQENHNQYGSFDLFARKLPPNRNYLIATGLEQALEYITNLTFSDEEIQYLRNLSTFKHIKDDFFDYLREFRFTGDVYAVEEGEIVFPEESILQVHAPMVEAQILETYLLATIQHQTMIASKAARVNQAAKIDGRERAVLEFGSRRAHGAEAGVLGGRAAYIGGCKGTSNTLSGFKFDIPVSGTMAHSWVMAYEDEKEAFEAFHRSYRDQAIYLVDTYNSLKGTEIASETGEAFKGIRLDSGDLVSLSKEARKILDNKGYSGTLIFASGDLDEFKIKETLKAGAYLDAFGVGTQLSTAADAPYISMVYKLSEYDQANETRYKIKLSNKKQTLPGLKQVHRTYSEDGIMDHDLISFMEENGPANSGPLISQYVQNGRPIKNLPEIHSIRERTLANLKRLPNDLLSLDDEASYPVYTSREMQSVTEALAEKIRAKQSEIRD